MSDVKNNSKNIKRRLFGLFLIIFYISLVYYLYINTSKRITDSVKDKNSNWIIAVKETKGYSDNYEVVYYACYNTLFCGDDIKNKVDEKKYKEVKKEILNIKLMEINKEIDELN